MGRRGYPPEFRRRVIDLLDAGRKVVDLARDLGISNQTAPPSLAVDGHHHVSRSGREGQSAITGGEDTIGAFRRPTGRIPIVEPVKIGEPGRVVLDIRTAVFVRHGEVTSLPARGQGESRRSAAGSRDSPGLGGRRGQVAVVLLGDGRDVFPMVLEAAGRRGFSRCRNVVTVVGGVARCRAVVGLGCLRRFSALARLR